MWWRDGCLGGLIDHRKVRKGVRIRTVGEMYTRTREEEKEWERRGKTVV